MNFKLLIALFPLIAFICKVDADLKATYPDKNAVWKIGQEYEVKWHDTDKISNLGKKWQNMRIDIMTGDNTNEKFLTNLAKNVNAKTMKSVKIKVPDVEPHAPIYFLMFSSPHGQKTVTSRFAITGEDGKVEPAEETKQPGGAPIPWGIGRLMNADAQSGDEPPFMNSHSKKDKALKSNSSVNFGYPTYLIAASIAVLIRFFFF